MAWPFLCT